MARHVSGTFVRTDRVNAPAGTTVRVLPQERGRELTATLLELGMTDLLATAADVPALGSRVNVALTMPGRYLEFEIPGMVGWHLNGEFGVSFDYLSARQTYGLVLAIDVIRQMADQEPVLARVSRR